MTDALLSAGIDRCVRAGTTVSRSTDAAEPPAVASPAADTADQGGGSGARTPADAAETPTPESLLAAGRPVAVEPLPETGPTVTLSRLWNNRNNRRATLFVVPTRDDADAVEELLLPPVGVPDADDDGRRFHAGPDRVGLAEGGYAAVPTGPELVWRETQSPSEPAALRVSGDSGQAGHTDRDLSPAGGADRSAEQNDTWIQLRAGGTVLARLEGVDALACPSRARFPYAYRRDDDKQIRVVDFAGRPVQRYPGIGAMRRGGFRPVPAPLVPERMFDGSVAGWWAVLPATAAE